jgi:hypothetical protein
MKLSELQPRWLSPNLFVFLCPHCRKDFLACKNAPLSESAQFDLYEKAFGDDWNLKVVPCRAGFAWTISGDFSNLTVKPSIDASRSGHWHGYITNGLVR